MQRASARRVAQNALRRWRTSRDFADAIAGGALARSGLTAQDRAFALELFYGVLRNLTLLDLCIAQLRQGTLDDGVRDVVRLGLFQLLILKTPEHAAVFETVELSPARGRALTNALLRNATRRRKELIEAAASQPLHVRLSHPEFLVRKWTAQVGSDKAERLCQWNNTAPPPLYARVNRLRISAADFVTRNPSANVVDGFPDFYAMPSLP